MITVIYCDFYLLRFREFALVPFQRLLRVPLLSLRLFHTKYSGGGFLQPDYRSIYVQDFLHRTIQSFCLLISYPLYFLLGFQEINEQDYNMMNCRNDDKRKNHLEFHQMLIRTLNDVYKNLYSLRQSFRIHLDNENPSIPSSAIHCKRFVKSLYLPSPKSVQFVFVLDLAYQHLRIGVGRLPGASTRGHLCFDNYNIGRAICQ
jgi:hypothetical protein